MVKHKLTLIFLVVLCSSLALMGCKDTEKEKSIKEAQEAKAELAKVKAVLAETESERDALKASIAKLSESLENTKS